MVPAVELRLVVPEYAAVNPIVVVLVKHDLDVACHANRIGMIAELVTGEVRSVAVEADFLSLVTGIVITAGASS